jgi:4-carboxymuconolactone decarboxylase
MKDKGGKEEPRLEQNWDKTQLREKGEALRTRLGAPDFLGELDSLASFDPSLPNYVLEFFFGEIMSRPGIDLRTRMLCAIPPMMVNREVEMLGDVMRCALDAGATKEEIIQVVIQTGCFAGFPTWHWGVRKGLEVFRERGLIPEADPVEDEATGVRSSTYDPNQWDKSDLWKRGWTKRDEIAGADTPTQQDELRRFDPLLVHYHMEFRYGEVYTRPELDTKTRELCRMATWLATGDEFPIEGAMRGVLTLGGTKDEIVEIVIQTGVLCGIPRWAVGARCGLNVFENKGLLSKEED